MICQETLEPRNKAESLHYTSLKENLDMLFSLAEATLVVVPCDNRSQSPATYSNKRFPGSNKNQVNLGCQLENLFKASVYVYRASYKKWQGPQCTLYTKEKMLASGNYVFCRIHINHVLQFRSGISPQHLMSSEPELVEGDLIVGILL